ncbi:hypothetical protein VTN77DRAFT_444 [Rasamsonia byssochlamydoides]|uniref:uncharacterized protein n=1 Tax=Rasamsonia byssochlamydoides TaxID=89139 RepID=UPI00374204E8
MLPRIGIVGLSCFSESEAASGSIEAGILHRRSLAPINDGDLQRIPAPLRAVQAVSDWPPWSLVSVPYRAVVIS